MIKKITTFILLLILSLTIASAEQTVINIDNIEHEQVLKFKNHILTEFNVIDNSDRITELDIMLLTANTSANSGVSINLSNDFTYTVMENRFTYLGFVPYREIVHGLFYKNTTIFTENQTFLNILPANINIRIKYDINSGNTTFKVLPSANYFANLEYETERFVGIPSDRILINGLSLFNVDITVVDVSKKIDVAEQKRDLSGLSKSIYKLLTLGGWIGESTILLSFLRLLDLLFDFIIFIYNILFVFPILIIFWVVTAGNFYVSWKCNTSKEFLMHYNNYYNYIAIMFIGLLHKLYNTVMGIIRAIGGLIPFT